MVISEPNEHMGGQSGAEGAPALLQPISLHPEAIQQAADSSPSDNRNEQYQEVLRILHVSLDLGIDNVAKTRLQDALESPQNKQLVVRELLAQRVINRVQLARAMARTNKARELLSILDIPSEAYNQRQNMQPRLKSLLRRERIIPIAVKKRRAGRDHRYSLCS